MGLQGWGAGMVMGCGERGPIIQGVEKCSDWRI